MALLFTSLLYYYSLWFTVLSADAEDLVHTAASGLTLEENAVGRGAVTPDQIVAFKTLPARGIYVAEVTGETKAEGKTEATWKTEVTGETDAVGEIGSKGKTEGGAEAIGEAVTPLKTGTTNETKATGKIEDERVTEVRGKREVKEKIEATGETETYNNYARTPIHEVLNKGQGYASHSQHTSPGDENHITECCADISPASNNSSEILTKDVPFLKTKNTTVYEKEVSEEQFSTNRKWATDTVPSASSSEAHSNISVRYSDKPFSLYVPPVPLPSTEDPVHTRPPLSPTGDYVSVSPLTPTADSISVSSPVNPTENPVLVSVSVFPLIPTDNPTAVSSPLIPSRDPFSDFLLLTSTEVSSPLTATDAKAPASSSIPTDYHTPASPALTSTEHPVFVSYPATPTLTPTEDSFLSTPPVTSADHHTSTSPPLTPTDAPIPVPSLLTPNYPRKCPAFLGPHLYIGVRDADSRLPKPCWHLLCSDPNPYSFYRPEPLYDNEFADDCLSELQIKAQNGSFISSDQEVYYMSEYPESSPCPMAVIIKTFTSGTRVVIPFRSSWCGAVDLNTWYEILISIYSSNQTDRRRQLSGCLLQKSKKWKYEFNRYIALMEDLLGEDLELPEFSDACLTFICNPDVEFTVIIVKKEAERKMWFPYISLCSSKCSEVKEDVMLCQKALYGAENQAQQSKPLLTDLAIPLSQKGTGLPVALAHSLLWSCPAGGGGDEFGRLRAEILFSLWTAANSIPESCVSLVCTGSVDKFHRSIYRVTNNHFPDTLRTTAYLLFIHSCSVSIMDKDKIILLLLAAFRSTRVGADSLCRRERVVAMVEAAAQHITFVTRGARDHLTPVLRSLRVAFPQSMWQEGGVGNQWTLLQLGVCLKLKDISNFLQLLKSSECVSYAKNGSTVIFQSGDAVSYHAVIFPLKHARRVSTNQDPSVSMDNDTEGFEIVPLRPTLIFSSSYLYITKLMENPTPQYLLDMPQTEKISTAQVNAKTIFRATLYSNMQCLRDIREGKFQIFRSEAKLVIGPIHDDLIESSCFFSLPKDIIDVMQTNLANNRTTINKFWPSCLHNMVISLFGRDQPLDWSYLDYGCKANEIALLAVAVTITAVTVLGNVFVLAVILATGLVQEATFLLRASLAVADLLLGAMPAALAVHDSISIMRGGLSLRDLSPDTIHVNFSQLSVRQPPGFQQLRFERHGYPMACSVVFNVSCIVSLLSLALMSVERLSVVLGRPLNRRFVSTGVGVSWLVGVALSLLINWRQRRGLSFVGYFDPITKLTISMGAGAPSVSFFAFYLVVSILSVAGALTVMLIVATLAALHRSNRIAKNKLSIHSAVRDEEMLRLTWTLLHMVLLFGLSSVPVAVDALADLARSRPVAHFFAWWLFVAGASWNWALYSLSGGKFRKHVIQLLARLHGKGRGGRNVAKYGTR
ncbi:putative histamine H2 receptor-like [Penaeus vannamei]|uniref:Putative histamine H2 receptor-like n=1 Tax=Penaeus vannamei TaxID=6689 RepID=A0A423T8V7_PENVA|nr:putative histamine H2 receptor-like [Penaeus vannamei]